MAEYFSEAGLLNQTFDPTALALRVLAQGGVASGATDSGNPLKVGGVYNATAPTLLDGQRSNLRVDINGNTLTSEGTAKAGEDLPTDIQKVEQRFDYLSAISASTLIKTGVGRVAGFFVSAASSTPTITVYDNTSAAGNKIIDTFTPVAGTMYTLPTTNFTVGLYIAIGGTVSMTPFYK